MYKKTAIDYLSIMHHTNHLVRMFYSQLLSILIPVTRYLFTHTNYNNNGVAITKVDTALFLRNPLFKKTCLGFYQGPTFEMQEPYCNHLFYLSVYPSVNTFLCDALTVQSLRSYKHFTNFLFDAITQNSFSYIDFIFILYAWYYERKTPTGIVFQLKCTSHSESVSTSLISYVRYVITRTILCLLQHKNKTLPRCLVNEREEFIQETQHTQQTTTRKAQNQDKKTACM